MNSKKNGYLKKIFPPFLLAGGSVFFSLLILEIVLRTGCCSLETPEQSPQIWSERPHAYYKPGGTKSFKNYPFKIPKPQNVFRIAAIGDSFTYPHLIQFDDAYPQRLARILNLNSSNKVKAEVINYGMSGLSTLQEIHEVKRAIHAGADLILLEITLNDPQSYNFQKRLVEIQKDYPVGELIITPEVHPIYFRLKSLGFIASRIHRLRSHQGFIDYNLNLYRDKDTWNSFAAALLEIKKICKKSGVPLYVFTMPFFHAPMNEEYPFMPAHRKINKFLKRKKIRHRDLFYSFEGIPNRRLHVIPDVDSHPNEIAHRIIAESLYEWLIASKVLPETFQIETVDSRHN